MRLAVATLIAALIGAASQALAGAEGAQVGVLTCESIPGTRFNIIIHSSVQLKCVFETSQGEEGYQGEMGIGLGLDLNWERNETIRFGVIGGASDATIGSYALAGRYVGGKASVTLGQGFGAAGLIGGGKQNMALLPLGIEISSGLGVSAGVGYLFLEPGRDARGGEPSTAPPSVPAP